MSRLLLNAAQSGNTKHVKHLVKKLNYLEIDFRSQMNQTPLMLAAAKGSLEIVQILLKKGADPNAKDSYQETPLSLAVRLGNPECAIEIYQKGGRITEEVFEELGQKETQLVEDLPKLVKWRSLRPLMVLRLISKLYKLS